MRLGSDNWCKRLDNFDIGKLRLRFCYLFVTFTQNDLKDLGLAVYCQWFIKWHSLKFCLRRKGAGFALMQEAERLARLENFRTMSLCTSGSDPALQSFYRRQGFEIRATRPFEFHPAIGMAGTFALMVRELQG